MGNTNTWCVYVHTAPNGKVYIGITSKEPNIRWCNGHGYSKSILFQRAIDKYGWENITHEILIDKLTEKQAKQLEVDFIKQYKANDRAHGYNMTLGGEGTLGYKSVERNKKIAESKMLEVSQYDINGSLLKTYKSLDEAERITGFKSRSIGRVCNGIRFVTGGYIWRFGHDQISSNEIARIKPLIIMRSGWAVNQIDKKSGYILNTFKSCGDAARYVNGDPSKISLCCKKAKNYKTHMGYRWEFVNEIQYDINKTEDKLC